LWTGKFLGIIEVFFFFLWISKGDVCFVGACWGCTGVIRSTKRLTMVKFWRIRLESRLCVRSPHVDVCAASASTGWLELVCFLQRYSKSPNILKWSLSEPSSVLIEMTIIVGLFLSIIQNCSDYTRMISVWTEFSSKENYGCSPFVFQCYSKTSLNIHKWSFSEPSSVLIQLTPIQSSTENTKLQFFLEAYNIFFISFLGFSAVQNVNWLFRIVNSELNSIFCGPMNNEFCSSSVP
jgi:hypothetical protein